MKINKHELLKKLTQENYLKFKTLSIKEEQLEALRKLSKETGIPQSLLIRRTIDNLLRDRKKLNEKAF
ncbi:unnamed protein product [marine sediment metagenome]|uniref:Predicted DNA-binding protein ribbon-helix-helix domain-containing protein n=1 Tax=marine sediment metagenome TaxID=412755 RepID=X1HDU2_9ZZZZ